MNQKGFIEEAVLGLAVIFVVLIVVVLLGSFRYDSTQAGDHTGFITAVQQQGIFFKNWSIYVKTDNSSSQEDLYCVEGSDQKLVDQLKEVSRDRKLVTISYDGVRGFGWQLCHAQRILSVQVH